MDIYDPERHRLEKTRLKAETKLYNELSSLGTVMYLSAWALFALLSGCVALIWDQVSQLYN